MARRMTLRHLRSAFKLAFDEAIRAGLMGAPNAVTEFGLRVPRHNAGGDFRTDRRIAAPSQGRARADLLRAVHADPGRIVGGSAQWRVQRALVGLHRSRRSDDLCPSRLAKGRGHHPRN